MFEVLKILKLLATKTNCTYFSNFKTC